ncbi:hypothetical protein, conserved [Trypanosoma brucei gambiense DAL972]|uniref:Uncharacterized protein n=2 Tax=Trypanosoma brucei TaxID=5691 RepID=C9ZZB9_TRYB9|nr:hypothetical protein, conserved [Trypanosoma brucei gambiense DAL972]CBH14768.1 hypothetical protein, conserved [Trypanosoma brucei gambiense DAL972]|eukprot:XP_011777034.1 hypothetical protein, conserved [Trypanosoma brucei gambiense DAL972]
MKKAKKQEPGGRGILKHSSSPAGSESKMAWKCATAVLDKGSDIADIFGVIKDKKLQSSAQPARGTVKGQSRLTTSDGLYRAPEKTLELSDADFFNVSSQPKEKKGRNKKTGKGGDPLADCEVPETLLRREGVDRIITVEELRKITSSNPNAGTTPNCPFDCDCCF